MGDTVLFHSNVDFLTIAYDTCVYSSILMNKYPIIPTTFFNAFDPAFE